MLTLQEIQLRLKDRMPGLVAKATGRHVTTIIRIRDNEDVNPEYETLKAISKYFEDQEKEQSAQTQG